MVDKNDLSNDEFVFAEEESGTAEISSKAPWKILIVDDDSEVHSITNMVLRDTLFDGAPLEILSAYSGAEAVEKVIDNPDIAVILLDVVMENDHSGLETVEIIRNEICNSSVRIILRTGQPGKAPERSVIVDYDINDYREKTELTSQKLFTSVVAALRNYRDMLALEKTECGMRRVVDASTIIFQSHTIKPFSMNVLEQVYSIFSSSDFLLSSINGLVATEVNGEFQIMAAVGSFSSSVNKSISPELLQLINSSETKGEHFSESHFLVIFESQNGIRNCIFLDNVPTLSDLDKNLIQIFCRNIGIAYENIYLNIDMIETQKDIILLMGDVVETRSKESANHVYRVAEYSYLLAKKIGMNEDEARVLRQASPMHDVGKVGIPDAILLKPDTLTKEEFSVMKTHTTLGHSIFSNNPRKIIKAAATIAHEHHERWDGTGYPSELVGKEISLFARITSLADVFDALSSKRTYKPAWETEEVFNYIVENRGTMFDPSLVDAFIEIKDDIMTIKKQYSD